MRSRIPLYGGTGGEGSGGAAHHRELGSGMLEASLLSLYSNHLKCGDALADISRLRYDTAVPQPPPRSATLSAPPHSDSPPPAPQRTQPTSEGNAPTLRSAPRVTECRVNARPWLPSECEIFERELEHRGKHFGEIARSIESRTTKEAVAYYYMHYKRLRALRGETKAQQRRPLRGASRRGAPTSLDELAAGEYDFIYRYILCEYC